MIFRFSKRSLSAYSQLVLGLMLLLPGTAQAYALQSSYVPPEIAYADDLRQRITLPFKVNLNQLELEQLQVLPGFSEELALKVIRKRPFTDIQDFYRKMPDPGLSAKQVENLIQQLQPKLLFK